METEQRSDQLYSVTIQLDGNRIYFARDVTKTDAEKMATELRKTVVGEIEIAANECRPINNE